MFISINYSERPAPAKVVKHGVNQLKDKDFMPWPVTPRSETCIHHCHILLTVRTTITVNALLMLIPRYSCYLQATDHSGFIKETILILQRSCSNCTKAPQLILSQPQQFMLPLWVWAPAPPAPRLPGCSRPPELGGGRLGGICRLSWATAFGHIPASCPENLIKHCPSPLLCSSAPAVSPSYSTRHSAHSADCVGSHFRGRRGKGWGPSPLRRDCISSRLLSSELHSLQRHVKQTTLDPL